jgi:hypothetical protein
MRLVSQVKPQRQSYGAHSIGSPQNAMQQSPATNANVKKIQVIAPPFKR